MYLTNEKLSRDVIGTSGKMEPRYSMAHRDALTRTKSRAIRPLSRTRRGSVRLRTLKNVKSAANGEIDDDYVRVLNAAARPWPAAISNGTVCKRRFKADRIKICWCEAAHCRLVRASRCRLYVMPVHCTKRERYAQRLYQFSVSGFHRPSQPDTVHTNCHRGC